MLYRLWPKPVPGKERIRAWKDGQLVGEKLKSHGNAATGCIFLMGGYVLQILAVVL